MPFERQTVVIYAVTNGYFDAFPAEKMTEVEDKFLAFMDRSGKDILEAIKKERAVSDETEGKLKGVIQKFNESVG